ncbi:MAG: flippase [Gammaproteobacteria bacterium]|nr:flippase [Gammaproteobacteria bacterium]
MLEQARKLARNTAFRKYFLNTSWMFFEKGVRFVSIFLVGIFVGRYLGPEKFGLLSYAVAVTSIFIILSRLGMESVLVRELAANPDKSSQYISTAFTLLILGGIAALIVVLASVALLASTFQEKACILLISLGLLFQSFLVFDYAFQAKTEAKYSSLGKSVALLFSAILKIVLIIAQADLYWFAASYTIEHLLVATSLFVLFKSRMKLKLRVGISRLFALPLLKSAWPMLLSGIAGMILVRVDQIMIRHFLDTSQLGLYAAAIKIYEGWMNFPFIFSISMLPLITRLKSGDIAEFERILTTLFAAAFWSSAAFAVAVTLFDEQIISLTFGEEYQAAASTLAIIIWASLPASHGFMSARYLIVEKREFKIVRRNWIAIFLNVPLNLVMIPMYGIKGAAIATILSLVFVHWCLDMFDEDLAQLFRVKNRAMLFRFGNYES